MNKFFILGMILCTMPLAATVGEGLGNIVGGAEDIVRGAGQVVVAPFEGHDGEVVYENTTVEPKNGVVKRTTTTKEVKRRPFRGKKEVYTTEKSYYVKR